MAIVTASVLTACGVGPEDKESRAKTALEQKYHRQFEITHIYPQKFGDLYYEVEAYAVDEPQIRFTAAVDTEDLNVSDSYVERRVCAAISGQAMENLDGLPGYYYLYTHAVGPQPITDNAEISIKDYLALHTRNRFQLELFVVPEGKDAAAFYGSLAKLFDGLDYLTGGARLYLVDEEQMDAVQEFLEVHDTTDFEYKQLTKEFPCLEIPYDKGAIGMTGGEFAAAMEGML